MVDFRRLFLALVLVTFVTGTAYGQFQCNTSAVPASIRSEGRTELVGDIELTCINGPDTDVLVNVQVFLPRNVTSRLVGPPVPSGTESEALLVVRKPEVAGGDPVFQPGVWRSAFPNSLVWTNVTIPALTGEATSRTLRITNVRINVGAQQQQFVPESVFASITVASPVSLIVNNPTPQVASILRGIDFSVLNCDGTAAPNTSFAQCVSQSSAPVAINGLLRFSEVLQTAFKTQVPAAAPTLGLLSDSTESGYFDDAHQLSIADTGTRLIARFTGIPAGVRLFVTETQLGEADGRTSPTVLASLVNINRPNGDGSSALGTAVDGDDCIIVGGIPMREIPLTGGAGSATWEITATLNTAEHVSFGYGFAYEFVGGTPTTPASPALTTGAAGAVAGLLGPVSAVDLAAPASQAGAFLPRFADLPINVPNLITIVPCVTNLLFPFVTATSQFNTGIAISNTSLSNSGGLPGGIAGQPFNTPAQNGPCTLYYFGTLADGTQPANVVQTSTSIPAGGQLLFTLNEGGMGIEGMPGFTGYVIARCNFQYGHGFVFISDRAANQLAMGYLPLIIPDRANQARPADPFTTAGAGSEQLIQ